MKRLTRCVYIYRLETTGRPSRRPAFLAYFTKQGIGACVHDVPVRHSAEATKSDAIREHRERCREEKP